MYYPDEPITRPEEDEFARDVFVQNLANDINKWDSTASLVLALYGPWGAGKSSVLNLLKKQIEANNTGELAFFDPWYFNSTEQLIQTFIAVIKQRAVANAAKDDKTDLNEKFSKYGEILSKVFASVKWEPEFELPLPIGKIKISKSKKDSKASEVKEVETPDQVKNDLKAALSKINLQFIILIDNLDRLDPPELLLMFKLVRLCSDFPNFVFILAFDRKQVRDLISKQQIDPDFLAKIVQIDIELPLIEQDEIDAFVSKNIQNMINDLGLRLNPGSWERFARIYDQTLGEKLIVDLRKAKRYLNSLRFSMALLKNEVDFADFLILDALRVFYSKIHSGLPKYKKQLTTFEYAGGIDALRKQRLAELKDVKDWIASQYDDKSDIENCEQLLGFLFPTFGAYIQNPANPSIITRREEYLANQQICATEYFDRYFKFRLPKGEIPVSTLSAIEDSLNRNNETSENEVITLLIDEQERLSRLLRKLYFRAPNLSLGGRIILIKVLGKLGDKLEWELLNSFNSSASIAAQLTLKCIERFGDKPEVYDAIRGVISSTPSLSFASELIMDLLSPSYPYQIPQAEKDSLKPIMLDRLHKDLLDGRQNIFVTYPTSYYRIIGVWRSEQILNEREIASNYIYEQMSLDANALPKILITNATFELGTNKVHSFEFERLKRDYDVDRLYEILKNQESTANYSQIEQEVINAFNKYMNDKTVGSDVTE